MFILPLHHSTALICGKKSLLLSSLISVLKSCYLINTKAEGTLVACELCFEVEVGWIFVERSTTTKMIMDTINACNSDVSI